jgi:hypothetical protein
MAISSNVRSSYYGELNRHVKLVNNFKEGRSYGWTGQQSGSGFINLAPSILHYNWF